MRPSTLIFTILATACNFFLFHVFIHNLYHHLLVVMKPPPPPPPPPLPPPFEVVNELCMHNYYPSSLGNCFTKLMQIPPTKYAADSTEVIRIIIDKVYSLSRRARFKFDHAATFNATHLSSDSIKCLRKCQESSDAIVNYWYHRFEKDEFFPQIRSGTVHHFWRRARTHAQRCLYGHNCSGDKAVRAFTHSVFDEIEALVRLGDALRNRVGNIRSMRLTEIKPMPLVVRRWYVGETKRFRRGRAALGARANRLGSQVFRPVNYLN